MDAAARGGLHIDDARGDDDDYHTSAASRRCGHECELPSASRPGSTRAQVQQLSVELDGITGGVFDHLRQHTTQDPVLAKSLAGSTCAQALFIHFFQLISSIVMRLPRNAQQFSCDSHINAIFYSFAMELKQCCGLPSIFTICCHAN
ncbi:hypothetical protein VPH35_090138 [Triticum aestivum]